MDKESIPANEEPESKSKDLPLHQLHCFSTLLILTDESSLE